MGQRGDFRERVADGPDSCRIDPATGRVRGEIDFSGLLAAADRGPEADVLNGIAYDRRATGCWSRANAGRKSTKYG